MSHPICMKWIAHAKVIKHIMTIIYLYTNYSSILSQKKNLSHSIYYQKWSTYEKVKGNTSLLTFHNLSFFCLLGLRKKFLSKKKYEPFYISYFDISFVSWDLAKPRGKGLGPVSFLPEYHAVETQCCIL